MKLRDEDLKKIYQRPRGMRPEGKAACPSEDDILKSFTPEMSEEGKLRIADHVTECGACRWKFEAAREILKEAKALAAELEGEALSGSETAELRQRALEKIRKLEGRSEKAEKKSLSDSLRAFFFQYRYASVIAGLFMIALATWLVLKSPQAGRDDILRGRQGSIIELKTPRGIQENLPLLFRWQSPWEGGEAEVRVLNEELDVIWTSGRVRTTSIEFPASLAEVIKNDAVYYWKVIVYQDDGQINESDLQEFRLKK